MPLVDYIASLKENQFFGAGFGLVGVGAFLAVARKGSQYALSLFQRYGLTSLEITSRDKSYQWLLHWINAQGQQTQHLSVQTAFYQVWFMAELSGNIDVFLGQDYRILTTPVLTSVLLIQ